MQQIPTQEARSSFVSEETVKVFGIRIRRRTPKRGGLTEKGEKVSASISVTTIHYMIYAEAASRLEQSLSCVNDAVHDSK